jgi:putative ABC transport system substrate-binding protein
MSLSLDSFKLDNSPYDFEAAFQNMSQGGPKALLVLSSPLFTPHRAQIAELAIRFQLPAMFIFRTYVEAGGLMSYGVDVALMYQRAASYVFSGARSRLVCLSIRPINSISL